MAKAKTTKAKPASKAAKTTTKSKSAKAKPARSTKAKPKAKKKTPARKAGDEEVVMDRRRPKPAAEETDQREDLALAEEGTAEDAPERRQKVNRRRQIDPTTCERDYNNEEIEFMHALDAYKRAAGRMFPTCSEILEVVRDLGYRRLSPEEVALLAPPVEESLEIETPAESLVAVGAEGEELSGTDVPRREEYVPSEFDDDSMEDF